MSPFFDKAAWYWNRLNCMSYPEIWYRIQSQVSLRLQKFGFFVGQNEVCIDYEKESRGWIQFSEKHNYHSNYCVAGDKILSGYLDIFSHQGVSVGETPNWNKNPITGQLSPLIFGKTLDYRNESLVGDIKYLWEPARHLHLVTLAQAYLTSTDEKYLKAIKHQITSFIDQCPHMQGVHWSSSLELGIRLINWSIVWQMIGGKHSVLFLGAEGILFKKKWIKSIYQHCNFISGYYSRYSSANNHLIGEACGLFIATLTWPYWKTSEYWKINAKQKIEHEAIIQNSDDGVNLEQAISYQQFVLDFLILAGLAGQVNNEFFDKKYWNRVELMLEFVASIMDIKGNVPMLGDADDGFVTHWDTDQNRNPYRSLLALGAGLFERPDLLMKGVKFDDKSYWLLTEKTIKTVNKLDKSTSSPSYKNCFPQGGYFVLGHQLNSDKEIRVIADAGPLGYGGIAAHGHADALSFSLNFGGEEFLIDPGTYSYHVHKKWREYFRGTSAHNTITVDGQNQSESGGNFMWKTQAESQCMKWVSDSHCDQLVASHNGFERLSDPVVHTRTLKLNKLTKQLSVEDRLTCSNQHKVCLYWHFSEKCHVENKDNTITVTSGERTITMQMPTINKQLTRWYGSEGPPLGWVSRGYDKKTPTTTLTVCVDISCDTAITTLINFK